MATEIIQCRSCHRTVDLVPLGRPFGHVNKKDRQETKFYQKVMIKDHRISFWSRVRCRSSGKRMTIYWGSQDGQSLGGRH
jgi:hypothetical protein